MVRITPVSPMMLRRATPPMPMGKARNTLRLIHPRVCSDPKLIPIGRALRVPTLPALSTVVSVALPTSTFAPGTRKLWVRGRDALGNWGAVGALVIVVNGAPPLAVRPQPLEYALGVGVPNPASSRSLITFSIPEGAEVDLSVYDITGRRMRSLVSGRQPAGVHESAWDLRDETGGLVRAGVYYYRLEVAGRTFTRRLIALN